MGTGPRPNSRHRQHDEPHDKSDEAAAASDLPPRQQPVASEETFASCYDQAVVALESGENELALLLYTRAIELRADAAMAFQGRANAYSNLSRWQETMADAKRAIALDPTLAAAHCLLARGERRTGDPKASIAHYTRAIELNDTYQNAILERGCACDDVRDFDSAARDYARHLELDPDSVDTMLRLARVQILQNSYEDAERMAGRAIALSPTQAIAYSHRGRARKERGDTNGALTDMRRAIELGAEDADYLRSLIVELEREPPPEVDGRPPIRRGDASAAMKPVATFSRWKPLLAGAFSGLVGVAALGVALLLVPWFVKTEVVEREHGSWVMLLMGVIPLLIGWVSLSTGILRIRATFEKDLRLLAGPDGISLRVPGRAKAARLWFSYDLVELVVPWAEVVRCYVFTTKVNGVPMSRRLIVETRRGTVSIEGVLLRERPSLVETRLHDLQR